MNNQIKIARNLGAAAALASSSMLAPLKAVAADIATVGISTNQPVTVTAFAPRLAFDGRTYQATLRLACIPWSLTNYSGGEFINSIGLYEDIGPAEITLAEGTNSVTYPLHHVSMAVFYEKPGHPTNRVSYIEIAGPTDAPVAVNWPEDQAPLVEGASIRTYFPDGVLTNTAAENLLKLEQGNTVFPGFFGSFPATVTVTVPQSPSVQVPQLSKLPDNRLSVAWKDPTLRLQRSDSITGTYADVLVDGTNAVSPYLEDMATGGPARLSEIPREPTAGKKGVVVPPKQRQGFFRLQRRATEGLGQ